MKKLTLLLLMYNAKHILNKAYENPKYNIAYDKAKTKVIRYAKRHNIKSV